MARAGGAVLGVGGVRGAGGAGGVPAAAALFVRPELGSYCTDKRARACARAHKCTCTMTASDPVAAASVAVYLYQHRRKSLKNLMQFRIGCPPSPNKTEQSHPEHRLHCGELHE